MIPKRLQVLRLFHKDKINNCLYNPSILDSESDKWIPNDKNDPDKSDVFYVRKNKNIFKAIYLRQPIKGISNWWHPILDEYIDSTDITHWMEIKDGE